MASGNKRTKSATKNSATSSRSGPDEGLRDLCSHLAKGRSAQPQRQCGKPLGDHIYCTQPYQHTGRCDVVHVIPKGTIDPAVIRWARSRASDARFHAQHWWDGPPLDWEDQHDRALEYTINHGAGGYPR